MLIAIMERRFYNENCCYLLQSDRTYPGNGRRDCKGISAAGGEARLFSVEEEMDADYINSCDGVIFGTPTWMANTCWQMKNGLMWTAVR